MSKVSAIDKRIAELEAEIQLRMHGIAVLRSVQTKKGAKPAKAKKAVIPPDLRA